MRSTPVTAGANAFFAGMTTAGASANTDVENSFSDVLKSQNGDGSSLEANPKPSTVKKDEQPDRYTDSGVNRDKAPLKTGETKDVSMKDMEKRAEDVAQEAAGQMLKDAAEELDMTEEEVLQLLGELNMTPMDLLQTANLQTVVLAAAGENDACSFVTNEQLFASLSNLTASLEEVISKVAEATGLDNEKVKEMLAQMMNQSQNAEVEADSVPAADEAMTAEEAEGAVKVQQKENSAKVVEVKEPEKTEEILLKAEEAQPVKTVEISGMTTDNSDVMNRGNLFRNQSQSETQNPLPQDAAQNPFMQNLLAKEAAAEAQNVPTQIPSYFDADTEMIMHQITDYMKGNVTDGVSELEMQLHPESLGNLHVKLTAKEGMVTAQFTAQNDAVKAVIETQMIQLKETFKEQGVTVEAIEVTVESHRFDENMHQNSGQQNQDTAEAERPKVRRINLNLEEEEEEFTEEERIAAELLRDSGGTVDYTV